jgi:hypothetical protein
LIDTDQRNRSAVNGWANDQIVKWNDDGTVDVRDRVEQIVLPDGTVMTDVPDWFVPNTDDDINSMFQGDGWDSLI